MDLYQSLNAFYYDMILNELVSMNENTLYPGITYNSLLYLDLISYWDNCTVSRLAQALGISKPAVTIKVKELMKQGLVEKKRSEADRRVYYLSVSPEVERDFQRYDKLLRRAVETIEARYTQEDMEKFCCMLSLLNKCYSQTSLADET